MIRKKMAHLIPSDRGSDRGQVLVFVALIFLVLLGFTGLVIDVGSAYSTRRFERSVADAASLAGAQDLQQSSLSQSVTNLEQGRARSHALASLVNQLKAGPPSCVTSSDISDCPLPGTPYFVSIKTPAPTCLVAICDADADHSVQVAVHNPSFETAFARLFGQATWDVGITSVAGITFSRKYAVITLQPPKPKPNFTDANLNKDIIVNGNNTVLNVLVGDIGTNTSATTTNSGLTTLANGYRIDHFDDLSVIGDTWNKPDGTHPVGHWIRQLITDPNYYLAQFPLTGATPAPQFGTQGAGVVPCSGLNFPTDAATLLEIQPPAGGTLTCYQPGIYKGLFTVRTKDTAYLLPSANGIGAYEFLGGMTVNQTLAGGLIDNGVGIVLVFPQNQTFKPNNAFSFLLNAGSAGCSSDSCRAAPTKDFAGSVVKTPKGLTLTIEVPRDGNCFSGLKPIISNSCQVNQNTTVNLAGGGKVVIAGVLYGPSDNMSINGGFQQGGLVGQIVSWSVTYTGGSVLNQSYPGGAGIGIMRLDTACSGLGTPCVP